MKNDQPKRRKYDIEFDFEHLGKYRQTIRLIVVVLLTVCGICLQLIVMDSTLNSIADILSTTSSSTRKSSRKLSQPKTYIHFPQPQTFNRGECIMNPVRYFVVLSYPRSVTGWFTSLLNNHTNISMYGEILFHRYLNQNIVDTVDTLDKFYNMDLEENIKPKNECTAAIGFIWMIYQNVIKYSNVIVPYLKFNGILPIFLFRKNVLRCIVSLKAATTDKSENDTDKFHVTSKYEADMLASYKPTINKIPLIPGIKRIEKQMSKCFEIFNNTPHVTIYYEDLVKNPDQWLDEVQDFLKVPRQKLISEQVKIHNGPLSSIVKNWEEVVATLNGTKYERFLYDD